MQSGPADDLINVGSTASELNTIAGTISIDGQGGFNTLTINDQNTTDPQTYTATSTSINRTGGPSVGYTNMCSSVALNAGRRDATPFTSATHLGERTDDDQRGHGKPQ